jgi:hypothetical protein
VPWARPGSGFSQTLEAFMVALCSQAPVAAVARLLGVSDDRVWRVLEATRHNTVARLHRGGALDEENGSRTAQQTLKSQEGARVISALPFRPRDT